MPAFLCLCHYVQHESSRCKPKHKFQSSHKLRARPKVWLRIAGTHPLPAHKAALRWYFGPVQPCPHKFPCSLLTSVLRHVQPWTGALFSKSSAWMGLNWALSYIGGNIQPSKPTEEGESGKASAGSGHIWSRAEALSTWPGHTLVIVISSCSLKHFT